MCTIPIVWIWLKWLSDATILHIDFTKIPGENPRTPPSTPPPLPKAASGPMNKWDDGLREYHTPGGGVSALLKPTAPERYHQSYCVYVRGVCPRWKNKLWKKLFLLYICRLYMVVFSKQITLLIHIIIHTNGTIKKNYFSPHTLEEKKFQPSMVLKKNFCLWKHVKKIFQPDQKTHPPPPPWKSNGRSLTSPWGLV